MCMSGAHTHTTEVLQAGLVRKHILYAYVSNKSSNKHTHRRVFEWSCGGVTGKGRRGSVGVTGQAGLAAERPGECQALCRRRWPLKRRSLDVMREPLKQPSRFRHLMYA